MLLESGDTTRITKADMENRGIKTIKKIGLVLVGGGGGAAGRTWLDIEKGKDKNFHAVPGSGGGGGGIVIGVLDLTYARSESQCY